MNFGEALENLKNGKKVLRAGWNGKGMWLSLVKPTGYSVNCIPENERELVQAPWLGMKTADNKFIPWVTSQADVLAEDYQILED